MKIASRQYIKEESIARSLLLIKDKNLDQFRAKRAPPSDKSFAIEIIAEWSKPHKTKSKQQKFLKLGMSFSNFFEFYFLRISNFKRVRLLK